MILIIDNYDSFTYNLVQLVESLGFPTKVVLKDRVSLDEVAGMRPDKIILSPGPQTPNESGICLPLINRFYKEIPILGVCLGHQCLGAVFGATTRGAKTLYHGKTANVVHDRSLLFQKIPSPFPAARYNSLALDRVPDAFRLTAWDENREIMAIEHQTFPLFGVQFHPESFMTPQGKQLMSNFLHAS